MVTLWYRESTDILKRMVELYILVWDCVYILSGFPEKWTALIFRD